MVWHLSIDYTEGQLGSYRAVKLATEGATPILFQTGDPRADWAASREWIAEHEVLVCETSSVTHFVMDNPEWRMEIIEGKGEMLLREMRPNYIALMDVQSGVPRHIARRYLTGQCDVIARVLNRDHKLPLWGMLNNRGEIEHVFVRHQGGAAVDIRGARMLWLMEEGSSAAARDEAVTYKPLSKEEVEATFGKPDRKQTYEARQFCQSHLSKVIEELDRREEADFSFEEIVETAGP